MTFVNFEGIKIYLGGSQGVTSQIKNLLELRRPIKVHLCNAYTISLSKINRNFRKVLFDSDLNIPDGRPLALCFSLSGSAQIRGMDLFNILVTDTEFKDMKHLFFGIAPEKRPLFEQVLTDIFSDARQFRVIEVPYLEFEKLDFESFRVAIESFEPNFIWIGLGTPKQDFAVDSISSLTNNPCVVIPIGAVFDFIMGYSSQAPKYLSNLGFEWMYRWAQEPRRLASRYTIHNFIFLSQVVKFLLKKRNF